MDDRIGSVRNELESIQESRNSETKSSAGDKYETGRAMLQIEENNYSKQLHQLLLLKNQLEALDLTKSTRVAGAGSLVITNHGSYFISIGLGEITVESITCYCVSAISPVGQKLINKQPGYHFEFNGKKMEILEIQ